MLMVNVFRLFGDGRSCLTMAYLAMGGSGSSVDILLNNVRLDMRITDNKMGGENRPQIQKGNYHEN